MSERGTYGKSSPAPSKKGGFVTIGIVFAIAVAIYAFSPGALAYYKTGKLPD